MRHVTDSQNVAQSATVERMSAHLIERFGDHAADVAVKQLAVAHATDAACAEYWMSIFLSIAERSEHGVQI